jgi:sulfite exporter TauE/SafE/copper chaperone CopZ
MTTHIFFVSGTHCTACKHLIEEEVSAEEGVTKAVVSLTDETLTIETTGAEAPAVLARRLSERVQKHGYAVHIDKPAKKSGVREWVYAVLFVLVGITAFVLLDGVGLASRIGGEQVTLGTAFFVGLVASVSTCLAVVGGLVLSVSATYAREGAGWRPQVLFHAGRLGGFFILGGLLGLLGESLRISIYGSAILGGIVSIVMLALGLHLLEVTKKVRVFTLPKRVSESLVRAAGQAGSLWTPLLLGAVTFFLPCGFTQSMQVVSLSSGDFFTGARTMFAFALGTLPMLALLSFGSFDLAKSSFRGVFFKTAGLLVILFALFNLQNTLAVFGIISPIIRL